ncbi:hypothetical protein FE236_02870 [Mariprofundus erugo]|uniref:YecA/YgfB family protein n=1 Tax=Mariprofundus erugo TaxID=2528639 RepID=UPI0010FCE338|nr:SEC-C metal-binding domain-containing protein [Mariprofundus erugo]TLS77565.1 hypothetical protein FE236_02870 [Mariprofundus erugo]
MTIDDMDDELSEAFMDDFQGMLSGSANFIRNCDPDAQRFIDLFSLLATENFFPFFERLNIENAAELRRLARLFAIQIWNATPLPSNHFRPLPLPEPKRNDPCLCGSGKKFKQCCARLGHEGMPGISANLMTALMLEVVTQAELKQAWQHLPHMALGYIASSWMREDEAMANRALMMLEPIFKQDDHLLDHRDEVALDAMFELCSLLDKPRKKSALIKRFMAHPSKVLQATALHRQCTVLGDQGKDAEAWACFQTAQRLDPNNPSLSHLELLLLMQQGKTDQMQQRGKYWLKRLAGMNRAGELDELIDLIKQMISDSPTAMAPLVDQLNPGAGRLIGWLQNAMRNPPALMHKTVCHNDLCVVEPKNREAGTLLRQWEQLVLSHEDLWQQPGPWLKLLEQHPQLAGSINVIDDLIGAVYDLDTPNPRAVFQPLVMLAMLQIKALLPMVPQQPFAWAALENRPALRVLGFLADTMEELDSDKESLEIREWLLRLNPNDNQGMRSLVINRYLQLGRNQDAVELARHYPEDFDVSINFGYALALFRLGKRSEADKRLMKAIRQSPRIVDALQRTRMKEPKQLHPGYISLGGEDEAWYYREHARDLWLATPDAMSWLKQIAQGK